MCTLHGCVGESDMSALHGCIGKGYCIGKMLIHCMAASVRNITSGGTNALPGVVYMHVQCHAMTRLKRFRLKRPIYLRPMYILGMTWFFSRCHLDSICWITVHTPKAWAFYCLLTCPLTLPINLAFRVQLQCKQVCFSSRCCSDLSIPSSKSSSSCFQISNRTSAVDPQATSEGMP